MLPPTFQSEAFLQGGNETNIRRPRCTRLRLGTLSAVAHCAERSELAAADRVSRRQRLRTGSRRLERFTISLLYLAGSGTV